MSTINPIRQQVSRGRVLVVTAGGSVLEYYDYALYGIAAALVFNTEFFPMADPSVGIILSLMTFGAGHLIKPLGSLFFSHFGDKLGRARVLFATMILLGLATVGIGLLPTYAQIGIWAPAGLLILRLLQGFASGAEVPGSAIFGVEAAPDGKRAFYASFTSIGTGIGATLAVLVFMLLSALVSAEALTSWAWRIPFLFGAVILVFVYFARRGIADIEKKAFDARDDIADVPLKEVLRSYRRPFFGSLVVAIGYTACSQLAATYSLTYMKGNGFSANETLQTNLVYQVLVVSIVPFVAMLSDRTNRKIVITVGAVSMSASFVLFFTAVPGANLATACLMIGVVAACLSLTYGGLLGFLAEQFPRHVRFAGMGVSFALGSAIGGGLSPMLAASVMELSNQSKVAMSLFGAGLAALIVCGALLLRNHARTSGEDLDRLVTDSDDKVVNPTGAQ